MHVLSVDMAIVKRLREAMHIASRLSFTMHMTPLDEDAKGRVEMEWAFHSCTHS